MRSTHIFVAASVLCGLTLPAPAQSLGDLAAQEKQKRHGKPPTKVITETELSRSAKRGTMSMTEGPTEAAPADAATPGEVATNSPEAQSSEGTVPEGGAPSEVAPGSEAANQPPAKKEKSADEVRAEALAAFRAKLAKTQANVQIYQTNVDNLQRELNDISGGVYSERRTAAVKMLEDAKAKLAASQAELAALEEEGRRAGFPR